ncbi:hypothetical protein [Chryseobacterium indoltheticum]|uniref:hypothetical protein n=1 Tax=Chryseobacterium indoltheticum TaxID=254 RepID=UPI003F496AE0
MEKEVHNLKLFEADELIYQVCIAVDEIVCQLGHLVKQQNYYIVPAGNTLNLYFTKDLTIHFLAKECLNDQRFENFNLSLSLNKLEERHNTFNTQITEALKNTAMEELRDMFEAQIKKQEKDNVREDIAARISELDESDLKYSKQWFIEYLDYLKTFEENSDANESKTIRFRKIERMDERGFYRLAAASAYIPENIDEAKHDTINIIFNTNKREK